MTRHFLGLSDAGGDAVAAMLNDALDRKAARAGWPKGKPDADAPLAGHVLAMIFEKNSTRTRVSFDMAIRQAPDMSEARYQRANVLLSLPDRLDEAIAGYKDTLRLKPDYPQAHHHLGTALARTRGNLAAAADELEEAARLDPRYFSAFYNLGLLYQEMPGHQAQAVARLERAVALRPDYAAAQQALARARAAEGTAR